MASVRAAALADLLSRPVDRAAHAAALPRLLGDDSPLAAQARDRLAQVARHNATLSHRIKRRLRSLAE
ncbi:hypothetical protein [Dactylosporangium sp. NPDC000521]|uniref:hypothetical protein n=1 Tax=Dactylosporangium sp. NPDC000521 TaxID=3363975 RepID=UPI0036A88BD2